MITKVGPGTEVRLSRYSWCNGRWEDSMSWWHAYSDEGGLASAQTEEELIAICNKAGWVILPKLPRKAVASSGMLGKV